MAFLASAGIGGTFCANTNELAMNTKSKSKGRITPPDVVEETSRVYRLIVLSCFFSVHQRGSAVRNRVPGLVFGDLEAQKIPERLPRFIIGGADHDSPAGIHGFDFVMQ